MSKSPTVCTRIAEVFAAWQNCCNATWPNDTWAPVHRDRIERIARNLLPSGSGFDSGTSFDFEASKPQRLVLNTSFHHMDDGGSYDGWTEHSVIVTPIFGGFDLRVTGRNRRNIKDYIGETFHAALCAEYPTEMDAY